MSRLAIVLCAVLFASAADAYDLPNALETDQQLTNTTIKTFGKKFESIKEHIMQGSRELEDRVKTSYDKIYDKVWKIQSKVRNITEHLIHRAGFLNTDDCFKLVDVLNDTIASVLSNATTCVEVNMKPVREQIQSISAIYGSVGRQAPRCFKNIDGVESVDGAIILCSGARARTAIEVFQRFMPQIENKTTELDLSIKTTKSGLEKCTAIKEWGMIYIEAHGVIARVDNCVSTSNRGSTTR